jgi:hypothetical protein
VFAYTSALPLSRARYQQHWCVCKSYSNQQARWLIPDMSHSQRFAPRGCSEYWACHAKPSLEFVVCLMASSTRTLFHSSPRLHSESGATLGRRLEEVTSAVLRPAACRRSLLLALCSLRRPYQGSGASRSLLALTRLAKPPVPVSVSSGT